MRGGRFRRLAPAGFRLLGPKGPGGPVPVNPGTFGNLLLNPGFEINSSGTTAPGGVAQSWTNMNSSTGYIRETSGARTGVAKIKPSNNAQVDTTQDVDVSAYAEDIDAGFATASAACYCRNASDLQDFGRVYLQAWDAGRVNVLATYQSSDHAGGAWAEIAAQGALPAGVRILVIYLRSIRVSGTINDMFWDDASMFLTIG